MGNHAANPPRSNILSVLSCAPWHSDIRSLHVADPAKLQEACSRWPESWWAYKRPRGPHTPHATPPPCKQVQRLESVQTSLKVRGVAQRLLGSPKLACPTSAETVELTRFGLDSWILGSPGICSAHLSALYFFPLQRLLDPGVASTARLSTSVPIFRRRFRLPPAKHHLSTTMRITPGRVR